MKISASERKQMEEMIQSFESAAEYYPDSQIAKAFINEAERLKQKLKEDK